MRSRLKYGEWIECAEAKRPRSNCGGILAALELRHFVDDLPLPLRGRSRDCLADGGRLCEAARLSAPRDDTSLASCGNGA